MSDDYDRRIWSGTRDARCGHMFARFFRGTATWEECAREVIDAFIAGGGSLDPDAAEDAAAGVEPATAASLAHEALLAEAEERAAAAAGALAAAAREVAAIGERLRLAATAAAQAAAVRVVVPLRLVSEANEHSHWRSRQARAKKQRELVAAALRAAQPVPPTLPLVVTITRVAPRALDVGDNLDMSAKHTKDSVADYVGVKDNDPRYTWRVMQRKGAPGEYAVEIVIEAGA